VIPELNRVVDARKSEPEKQDTLRVEYKLGS